MSKSTSQTTTVDPLQKQMAAAAWDRAQNIAGQPYQAYGGNLVQGFAPDQSAAYDLVRQGVQGNIGGQYLQQAGQAAQGAAGYRPQQVAAPNLGFANTGAQYMQPYQNQWTEDVVNTSLNDLDRSRQMAIGQGEDAAIRAGAYGGSRHGVADSLTNEASLRAAASTAAGLRSQGFDRAAQLGMSDAGAVNQNNWTGAQLQQQAGLANQAAGLQAANLGLGASQQLAGLSDMQRQQAFQNAAALEASGGAQQALGQRGLDSAYQQWQMQQNHPYQQLQTLLAPAGLAGGQSTTLNPSQAAQWGQGIGTLGGLLSMFGGKGG